MIRRLKVARRSRNAAYGGHSHRRSTHSPDGRGKDQVERPLTDHLVGDLVPVEQRVLSLWDLGHRQSLTTAIGPVTPGPRNSTPDDSGIIGAPWCRGENTPERAICAPAVDPEDRRLMGVEQEAAVRAFIADLEGEQLDTAQIERVVNRMTPDAEWHVVAWHDPFVGRDAIRAEFLRQAQLFRDLRIEILAIASIGGIVFTERIDTMLLRGKPLRAHFAGSSK